MSLGPYPPTLTLSQSGPGDILPSLRHQTLPREHLTNKKHRPGPYHWETHSLGQEVGRKKKDRGARSGRLG